MSEFKVVNNSNEIGSSWTECKGYSKIGKIITEKGREYKVIAKKERNFTLIERIERSVLGTLAVIGSLGFALISKDIRKLFTQDKKKVRFGIPLKKKFPNHLNEAATPEAKKQKKTPKVKIQKTDSSNKKQISKPKKIIEANSSLEFKIKYFFTPDRFWPLLMDETVDSFYKEIVFKDGKALLTSDQAKRMEFLQAYKDLPNEITEKVNSLRKNAYLFGSDNKATIRELHRLSKDYPVLGAIVIQAINKYEINCSSVINIDFDKCVLELKSNPFACQLEYFSHKLGTIDGDNFESLIQNCKNLKTLILKSSDMSSADLQSIRSLELIEKLTLENCRNLEIPAEIGFLHSLKELKLNNNNLTELPSGLGNLRALEKLDVSNNLLHSLPSEIYYLSSLKNLNISSNSINLLPDSVGELESLEKLSLSGNNIATLPESIASLPRLFSIHDDHLLDEMLRDMRSLATMPEDGYKLILELDPLTLEQNYQSIFINNLGTINVCSELEVRFPGVSDAGGPSRHLISSIFSALAKNHTNEDQVPTWEHKNTLEQLQNLGKLYESVGKVMAFIIQTGGKFPTGQIFNQSIFKALKKSGNEIDDYKKLSIQNLISLSEAQPSKQLQQELNQRFLPFLQAKTTEEAEKHFGAVEEQMVDILCLIDAFPDNLLTLDKKVDLNKLAEVQEFVLDQLRSYPPIETIIKPIWHIAKGFKAIGPIWNARRRIALMDKIVQGEFNSQVVKDNIIYNIEENYEINNNAESLLSEGRQYVAWMKEWIQSKIDKNEEEMVAGLLVFATGARSLCYDHERRDYRKLSIQAVPSHQPFFGHTCSQQLDIPRGLTKEQLFTGLDLVSNASGFQAA